MKSRTDFIDIELAEHGFCSGPAFSIDFHYFIATHFLALLETFHSLKRTIILCLHYCAQLALIFLEDSVKLSFKLLFFWVGWINHFLTHRSPSKSRQLLRNKITVKFAYGSRYIIYRKHSAIAVSGWNSVYLLLFGMFLLYLLTSCFFNDEFVKALNDRNVLFYRGDSLLYKLVKEFPHSRGRKCGPAVKTVKNEIAYRE